MAADGFEKNSLGWQLQQLAQRVGEWIELRLPRLNPSVPDAPKWAVPWWWLDLIFWFVVSAAVIWLGYLVYQWLSPYFNPNHPQYARFLDRTAKPQEHTIADWIRIAQDFQQQGNYGEACRALYMAMLQRLNDAKLIPIEASRTDGEYLRLVGLLPQSEAYQTLLQTHEQLRFGNTPISAELFDQCQQAYGTIERATLSSTNRD